jgi:hypothetical protein
MHLSMKFGTRSLVATYGFFHLSHVVLGPYCGHNLVAPEIRKQDSALGDFVDMLQTLRIEADYIPDVVAMKYDGSLDAYRFRADQVLAKARAQFRGGLNLALRSSVRKKA